MGGVTFHCQGLHWESWSKRGRGEEGGLREVGARRRSFLKTLKNLGKEGVRLR